MTKGNRKNFNDIKKIFYVFKWADQDYVLEQVNKKLLEDGMLPAV